MSDETKPGEVADLGDFVRDGRMTFEIDGRTFVFRVPDFEDLVELDEVLPIFPGAKEGETIHDALGRLSAREMIEHYRRCNRFLAQIAVRPELSLDDKVEPTDDLVPARSLGLLRTAIASALMAAAGRTQKADFRIRPTSGDTSSPSSTSSPAGTDAAPASSSSATPAESSTAGSG